LHSLSSFTDDIGLRREPKGSALPKFPSSVSDGGWFRGYTGSLLRCGLSSCSPPCTDLTRNSPQPTGTFTPELPASRSPFSSSGITTVATERFHRWDFHPLECQLASLHRLFHPLHSCRLFRKHLPADCVGRGGLGTQPDLHRETETSKASQVMVSTTFPPPLFGCVFGAKKWHSSFQHAITSDQHMMSHRDNRAFLATPWC